MAFFMRTRSTAPEPELLNYRPRPGGASAGASRPLCGHEGSRPLQYKSMSQMQSHKEVVLSFDRGTLVLTGPSDGETAEIGEASAWKWDRRVRAGAWRCDALHYASVRDALAARFAARFQAWFTKEGFGVTVDGD